MTAFEKQLEAAREEVARLERLAAGSAMCAELGQHDMQSIGGCNCGCHEGACCSVPVHACSRCGDCDYGDNEAATEARRECREFHPERHEPAEVCDCQHPETTPGGFAAISVGCPIHGDRA